jgi:predicted transposase YdaD
MLLGELPDLEETESGKDLIRIGEQRGEQRGEKRGEKRGREETILAFLAARYGPVPAAIQEKIATLTAAEADRLIQFLVNCQTLDELAQWLVTNRP